MQTIIRTAAGGPSRYTLELDDPAKSERYERTYTVRRYREADPWPEPGTAVAYYTVRDAYPRPVVLESEPGTAPALPAYVLEAVRREDARDDLRAVLPVGATVYTIRRSPMGRGPAHLLDLIAIDGNRPLHLTYQAATALGWSLRRDCIHMAGGGMDLGFAAVDALSWALYGRGGALRHDWL